MSVSVQALLTYLLTGFSLPPGYTAAVFQTTTTHPDGRNEVKWTHSLMWGRQDQPRQTDCTNTFLCLLLLLFCNENWGLSRLTADSTSMLETARQMDGSAEETDKTDIEPERERPHKRPFFVFWPQLRLLPIPRASVGIQTIQFFEPALEYNLSKWLKVGRVFHEWSLWKRLSSNLSPIADSYSLKYVCYPRLYLGTCKHG